MAQATGLSTTTSEPNQADGPKSSETIRSYREHSWPCAATYYQKPLVLDRGEGMHVWDEDGNRYLDCFGGVLTVSVGHANPVVNQAITEQIGKISHTSTLYINKPQTDLAAKLAEIAPGKLSRSFFTNSGTEADETAMVLARLYTGRQEIIALRHSYSGRSMLAMSAAGHAPWRHGGTYVAGIKHLAAPYCYRCPFGLEYPSCELRCARDAEELIQTTTDGQIAAFIAEPILGVGGFITPPKEYFREVTSIIRRYGGIFIADEVQTGWGRTGDKWFGIEHWDVEPDVMTSAKGMANGSPIGWTITTPEIAGAYPSLTFSTFGGNPVTSASALATIRVIEQSDLPRNAAVVGAYLRDRLEELKAKYPVIGDVRGMGLMQGIECVKDRVTKEPHPEAVLKVFEETRRRGVLIGKGGLYGNVIRLGPPLIASRGDIDEMVAALDSAFSMI
ncbi:MAG TPA: aspartate aminotransferase family protein [Thermoanaerobaculia bacterium]|nr:aspartate aminotransferase family protein [Thermoanaerobaculia bacterium]